MAPTQADAANELVVKGLTDLGVSDPQCISRSFLLKDGFYAGQMWRCEGWQAVWLLDGDSVEFYDASGNEVKTVPLMVPEEARKAA